MTAFGGGVLIGLGALVLFATLGRVAGISGITYAALEAGQRHWRLAFLLAMPLGGWLAIAAGAERPLSGSVEPMSILTLAISGLLVGAGTRLGNGCTSGHGVCGLARGTGRSLAAVATFMGIGMLTATLAGALS